MSNSVFGSLDEAAANRSAARETVKHSAMFRWLQLMAALHKFRRQHITAIRKGAVRASEEEKFWYASSNRITLLLALANAQIMNETVSVSRLSTDLFLSRAAVTEIVSEARECLFLDRSFRLNQGSQDVLSRRLADLLNLEEVRNFADTCAVTNIMAHKPIRLEDL